MISKYLAALCLLFTILIFPAISNAAPAMTGGIVFATDAAGGNTISNYWNTYGGDAVYNLYVHDGSGFINSGNDAGASLNYSLTPGVHTFTFYSEPNITQNSVWYGMNLFFDTDNINPAISVYAQRYLGGGSYPAIYTNSNANTRDLIGLVEPASGSLSYTSDNYIVTLTGYHVSDWTVNPTNQVGQYNNTPSGNNDYQGHFTLDVAMVPEPVSSTLFIIGGAALGFRRYRTNNKMT